MLQVDRSSRLDVFCKTVVLKNFTKITEKHLCPSLFFNKVAGLRPATLSKRDSGTGIFLWILRNYLGQLFLQNITVAAFELSFLGLLNEWIEFLTK